MSTKLHVNYNYVILKCSLIYDRGIVIEDQKFPSIWVIILLLFFLLQKPYHVKQVIPYYSYL